MAYAGHWPAPARVLGGVGATFALSAFSYHVVERPALRLKAGWDEVAVEANARHAEATASDQEMVDHERPHPRDRR